MTSSIGWCGFVLNALRVKGAATKEIPFRRVARASARGAG
jgi:hypothetical protein